MGERGSLVGSLTQLTLLPLRRPCFVLHLSHRMPTLFLAPCSHTSCRYKLPVIVCVMNNGGIYGGDRREAALAQAATQGAEAGGFAADPAPTSFVDGSR